MAPRARFRRAFALAAAFQQAQTTPERPGSYREEARVERVVVDAYVTDRYGDPIPGLGPADFRVRVDGKTVDLESADWIPADLPELPVGDALSAAPDGRPIAIAAPGRLIVFFFQTDFETSRLLGLCAWAFRRADSWRVSFPPTASRSSRTTLT